MQSYRITTTNAQTVLGTVKAETIEHAANVYVRRASRVGHARRTTGTRGLTGCFQGYRKLRGGGDHYTSIGTSFHVGPA